MIVNYLEQIVNNINLFGVFTGIAMLLAMISVLTLLPKLILTFRPFGEEVANIT